MVRIRPDDRASTLLVPVRLVVDRGLELLPDAPPLEVCVGPVDGFYQLDGDVVVLSDQLLGPGLTHPLEALGPVPPLDRWRRAAGSVLEAASLRELSRRTQLPPGADWRWLGSAIHAADAVAPELGFALPDLAQAVTSGSPGRFPRAGVAVMRAWAATGTDPIRHTRHLLEGGIVSATEWAQLGRWVLSSSGAAAGLPVQVDRVTDVEPPIEVEAWTWQPLRFPAHPTGAHLRVDGDGTLDEAWIEAGQGHRTVLASASTACRVEAEPGGPVGEWDVASAEGAGQVMGARGIRFSFFASGRLEIVLGDAFVGPLAAVAMAEQVGTSGVCNGAWRVGGRYLLRFDGIETQSLTLHGRSRDRFMMPAKGFGLGEWLAALGDDVWAWQVAPADRLVLRGRMLGGEVEVRLKRVSVV